MYVVRRDQLPSPDSFAGEDHGGLGASFLYVDAAPGKGPALHKHQYAEIFIVLEGESMFTAGDEERLVVAGEIVVVPPDTPHRFYNAGQGTLRQIRHPRQSAVRDRVARIASAKGGPAGSG